MRERTVAAGGRERPDRGAAGGIKITSGGAGTPERRQEETGGSRTTAMTTVGDDGVGAEVGATEGRSAPGAPERRGDLPILRFLRRTGTVAEAGAGAEVGARRNAARVRGRGGRRQSRLGEGRSFDVRCVERRVAGDAFVVRGGLM